MKNYPHTLILSPDPELLTPTESPHTTCLVGGKSSSVKLMCRRENKELAKTNLSEVQLLRLRVTIHVLETLRCTVSVYGYGYG